jgi:DNA-binding GntR family transcriptional regulator
MPKPGKINAILQDVVHLIESGEWGRSNIIPVPTRVDLARQYKVATSTINDVFNLLHAMGYVMPSGRNLMINPNRMTIPALVPSFDKYLQQHGLTPFMQNIEDPTVVMLDKDLAAAFDLPEGTKAIKRSRIQGETRNKQDIPYRITETYYLFDLADKYLANMTSDPLFITIDHIKQDTGKSITRSSFKILTRFPSEQEQNLLQVPLHTPVNEIFRVSRSDDGTIIMFSRIILISYRFTVSIDIAETKL